MYKLGLFLVFRKGLYEHYLSDWLYGVLTRHLRMYGRTRFDQLTVFTAFCSCLFNGFSIVVLARRLFAGLLFFLLLMVNDEKTHCSRPQAGRFAGGSIY